VGESIILVCDVCGRPATQSVTFRVGRRNLVKDFCSTHLDELTAGARAPRRGRRRGATVVAASKRRGRPPKATGAAPKRRGRPPKMTRGNPSGNGRRKRAKPAS
jgi:hypothetical protein